MGGLKLLDLRRIGRRFVRVKLHATDAGPRVRHFDERRFFKIGCAGNSVHQIWNQIGAPLIDILHLGPALIDTLLQPDEAIVAAAQRNGRNDDNENQKEDYPAATDRKFVHKVLNRSRNARQVKKRAGR